MLILEPYFADTATAATGGTRDPSASFFSRFKCSCDGSPLPVSAGGTMCNGMLFIGSDSVMITQSRPDRTRPVLGSSVQGYIGLEGSAERLSGSATTVFVVTRLRCTPHALSSWSLIDSRSGSGLS